MPRHDFLQSEPPGVSQTLAIERASRVADIASQLHLHIPPARASVIRGIVTLEFSLRDAQRALLFDFAQPADRLHRAIVNGRSVSVIVEHGHIMVAAEHLVPGRNTVTFEFVAGDEPLNRQDDLLYSLFVPARASTAFPCFDQPDLRVRWRLSLDVPADWLAVSNGREAARTSSDTYATCLFDETAPLPTYLFAFAAGRFCVDRLERNGRVFRLFHREADANRLQLNRTTIVEQHVRALSWMETYTGVPYPFDSFDIVLIPGFQFSGMEHPGAVYYNADTVLLAPTATKHQELSRANLIAHETAHMWFGNLVTMTWFDDVWMKEVLANFMAAKIVNTLFPGEDHDLRFLVQHYPPAYDVDRTEGSNSIRQPLASLDDAAALYGAVIYHKAPIVFRQLEMRMGAEPLRRSLGEFLVTHEFGSATWHDLLGTLRRHASRDLVTWSQAWIEERGRPRVSVEVGLADGKIASLAVRQRDPLGRIVIWPQHVAVLLGYDAAIRRVDVELESSETRVPDAAGCPAPDWVLPVGGGIGYCSVDLDPRTATFLTSQVHLIDDPLTRAAALIVRWEAMLDGQVPPAAVFEASLRELAAEDNELILQLLLEHTRSLFWRFTPASARFAAAAPLEAVLRTRLDRAVGTRQKAALFAGIQSVALSPSTVAWLEDVWMRRSLPDGIELSEGDETTLAMELAVRRGERADAILTAQMARIDSVDRRARLAFIRPALSSDPVVRAGFFESLRDARQRARETWVLDAIRYLHHPLRAEYSRRLVRPALELLAELHRTGDIFFAQRWAEATLSGYQSAAVAADVQAFLDSLPPDYPGHLRRVVVTAADPLFRAAELIAQT